MVKTNRSTLHTVYDIQQSATQGSKDTTHRLSCRTAATTRFSAEGIGCQKQTAPRYCQHPIRWALQSITVFKSARTWVSTSDASHTVGGKEFHRVRPERAKLLCPHVVDWKHRPHVDKEVLLFLVWPCGTLCRRPCVTHCWHWLRFVRSRTPWYSALVKVRFKRWRSSYLAPSQTQQPNIAMTFLVFLPTP